MVESGRLGNQVFQYLALRSVAAGGESIVLLGFDHLRTTFDGVDASFVHIASNPLRHLVSLDLAKVSRGAGMLPFIGSVREDGSARPHRDPGSRLALTEPAWFQRGGVLDSPPLQAMRVKPVWTHAARAFLDGHGLHAESTIVVHVRAGDYRSWPSPEFPAILSPQWYRARIAELRAERPDLAVIAIGDDPSYTSEVISGLSDAVVFTTSASTGYAQEFALLTMCGFGVLSASSFAYWGAYFAKRDHPNGRFIGPLYWAGHAHGSWFPEHIAASFIDYH